MLTKLGRQGYTVGEEGMEYGEVKTDPDSDPDADPELRKANKIAASDGCSAVNSTLAGTELREVNYELT